MERGGASVSMDAASMEMWDWEVLPDHLSSSSHGGHGRRILGDQETEELNLDAGADMDVDGCKDIGVDVPVPAETKPSQEEPVEAKATEEEEEEEEEAFKSSEAKVVDGQEHGGGEEEAAPGWFAGEEGGEGKKGRPECVVFSAGKLRVNGIGALCSFGVAVAAVCIFLVGGGLQNHHRQQRKIKLQLYGDDKRMQQVVQQT